MIISFCVKLNVLWMFVPFMIHVKVKGTECFISCAEVNGMECFISYIEVKGTVL